jgi:hypothetical protein
MESEIFHSLLLFAQYIMCPHGHNGIGCVLNVMNKLKNQVGENICAAVAVVRRACSKCPVLLNQRVELEFTPFPGSQITLAPPFFSMAYFAMGFKACLAKDSQMTFTLHAKVIICLLTSVTSIHILNGLTVIQAL